MTVTSPSANSSVTQDFGLFGNPESRRVEGFSIALGRELQQRPKLIPWQSVLENSQWEQQVQAVPRFLRLESPGRNWRVEQQLLLAGANIEDEESRRAWNRIPAEAVPALVNEPGRVHSMRQWFLGWRKTLIDLNKWAKHRQVTHRWLCPPEAVICMFDKVACQIELEKAGISVPPALGVPGSFDELWELMRQSGRRRIFLKPAHGSSASGVIAVESSRTVVQAFSTIELKDTPNQTQLYNQRSIRTWRGAAEVRRLVDAVCGERCLAQAWIPKAGFHDRPFDLRVVVIGGHVRHVMMRLGRGPITNSQLLGGKGDVERLRLRMGSQAWSRMIELCERAMKTCFPRSLYAGFDVLVEPDFQTSWIVEVNAFGDLLPRILHEERDTYQWEVLEVLKRPAPDQASAMGA